MSAYRAQLKDFKNIRRVFIVILNKVNLLKKNYFLISRASSEKISVLNKLNQERDTEKDKEKNVELVLNCILKKFEGQNIQI